MRTSEERARLIHRRTAEIKQERRIKETASRLDAGVHGGLPVFGDRHRRADAGIDERAQRTAGSPTLRGRQACSEATPALGYIIMGLLAFLPWGLRDGSSVPSASEM